MEIKLFEAADKKKSFTFSSLPEKISGSLGTKYQTYDIISQGAVKVPKGTEVAGNLMGCRFLRTGQKESGGCESGKLPETR